MATEGSHEEPPPDVPGAATGDETTDSEASSADRVVGRASPTEFGPGQLFDGDEAPPPARAKGWYRIDTTPPKHPNDPILPFVAPPVARRRRRDWPVLVVAIVVAGLVMAACCIAGFALYSANSPFQ